MEHKHTRQDDTRPPLSSEEENASNPQTNEPTPLKKRILAGIAALVMIILVIVYTYSMATGKIFAW